VQVSDGNRVSGEAPGSFSLDELLKLTSYRQLVGAVWSEKSQVVRSVEWASIEKSIAMRGKVQAEESWQAPGLLLAEVKKRFDCGESNLPGPGRRMNLLQADNNQMKFSWVY
jgi:hypothetical protein